MLNCLPNTLYFASTQLLYTILMTLRKSLIILFIVAVLVTFVREAGLCDFNYYRATTNHKLHTNWEGNSVTATLDKSMFHTTFPNRSFAGSPVVVLSNLDTLLYSPGAGPAMVMVVEDIESGALWTPLYKRASYRANVRSTFDGELIKVNDKHLKNIQSSITGKHVATGQTTILGLSSYRNSMHLLKTLIATDALNAARQYLSSLDGNVKN